MIDQIIYRINIFTTIGQGIRTKYNYLQKPYSFDLLSQTIGLGSTSRTLGPLSMTLDTWPTPDVSLDTWPIANAPRHLAYCQCPSTLGLLPMSLDNRFSLYTIGLGYLLRPRSLTSWLDQLILTMVYRLIQPLLPMSELRWLANRRNLILRTYSAPSDQQNPSPNITSANLLVRRLTQLSH